MKIQAASSLITAQTLPTLAQPGASLRAALTPEPDKLEPVDRVKLGPAKDAEPPNNGAEPGDESSPVEKGSRWLAEGANAIAKIPKVLSHVPGLIRFAIVEGVITTLQVASGFLGVVGLAGLGLAGGLEVKKGIEQGETRKVLSGLGEISRGVFVGSLSANQLFDLGADAATAQKVAVGAGILQGAFSISSGAMNLYEGVREDDTRLKAVGVLEMGMGISTAVAVANYFPTAALVAHGGFAGARFAVANWEQIEDRAGKIKARGQELWDDLKAEVSDEPEAP